LKVRKESSDMLEHVSLDKDESVKQQVPGDNGELDNYQCMPVPNFKIFTDAMKSLNIKSYDDVLLYSQVPKVFEELGNSEKSNLPHVNLLGIYRAQYMLELFGHKGNIYIL
jgi:hypothetical protein